MATHNQQLDRSKRRALPAPRGGTRWNLAPEIAPAVARWLAATGDDALADPAARAVKDGAHRTVYRVDLAVGAVYLGASFLERRLYRLLLLGLAGVVLSVLAYRAFHRHRAATAAGAAL